MIVKSFPSNEMYSGKHIKIMVCNRQAYFSANLDDNLPFPQIRMMAQFGLALTKATLVHL